MTIHKNKVLKLLLIASLVGTTFILPTTFNTYDTSNVISVNAANKTRPNKQSKNNMPNDSNTDDNDNGQRGHFILPKSYPAREGGNGNKSATIPKGTNLNYQLEPEGIDVWNKKYPKDDDYIIDNGGLKNSLKHHKKMPKGTPNIAKANARARRKQQQARNAKNQAKLRAQQKSSAKKSLPKTSDFMPLNHKAYIAIFALMITLLGSLTKLAFDKKKDK